jgi:hypothetical protein
MGLFFGDSWRLGNTTDEDMRSALPGKGSGERIALDELADEVLAEFDGPAWASCICGLEAIRALSMIGGCTASVLSTELHKVS